VQPTELLNIYRSQVNKLNATIGVIAK